MRLQDIEKDPVYIKLSDRFGTKQVLRDPYYRYYRVLDSLEKKNVNIKNKKTLDLGCLRPELSSLLHHYFGCDVTGVDQWNMLEDWKDYLDMEYYNLDLSNHWGDIITQKYDLVFALEIIEHMIDTDKFIDEVKKVLHHDSIVVFTTPNINSLRNRFLVPFGFYPAGLEYRNIVHHVRLYNPKLLKKHLASKGFFVFYISGVNFLPYKLIKFKFFRFLSEILVNIFPSFCPSFILFAMRKKINDDSD